MDENFEFEWDFSEISAVELSKERITLSEIKSVQSNKYAEFINMVDTEDNFHLYIVGFSEKKRFLNIYTRISDCIQPKYIEVADEKFVAKYY